MAPHSERIERKQLLFSVLIIGTGTLTFSYITGIAASWSVEDLSGNQAQTNVRPFNLSGITLFFVAFAAYAVFSITAFVFYFRRTNLTPAEIWADVQAAAPPFPDHPDMTKVRNLQRQLSDSRKAFRRQWAGKNFDQGFYRLYVHERTSTAETKLNKLTLTYAAKWHWRRKPLWRLTAILAGVISVALLLEAAVIAIHGHPSALILAPVGAVVLTLQLLCAHMQLIVQGNLMNLDLTLFRQSRSQLTLWAEPQEAIAEDPLAGLTKRRVLAFGGWQLWR